MDLTLRHHFLVQLPFVAVPTKLFDCGLSDHLGSIPNRLQRPKAITHTAAISPYPGMSKSNAHARDIPTRLSKYRTGITGRSISTKAGISITRSNWSICPSPNAPFILSWGPHSPPLGWANKKTPGSRPGVKGANQTSLGTLTFFSPRTIISTY